MSTDYSPGSSRGRRRSRRRRGPNEGGGDSRPRTPAQAPKPKSLWQKITSFFGGSTPEARPAAKNGSSAKSHARRDERREERPRTPRPPVTIEVTTARLYVGNLSFDATESDLFELFSGAGSVVNVEVVVSRHNMKSKGFAFVQMESVEEAKRAAEALHDKDFMGRKLLVSGAKAPEGRERSAQPEQ